MVADADDFIIAGFTCFIEAACYFPIINSFLYTAFGFDGAMVFIQIVESIIGGV